MGRVSDACPTGVRRLIQRVANGSERLRSNPALFGATKVLSPFATAKANAPQRSRKDFITFFFGLCGTSGTGFDNEHVTLYALEPLFRLVERLEQFSFQRTMSLFGGRARTERVCIRPTAGKSESVFTETGFRAVREQNTIISLDVNSTVSF